MLTFVTITVDQKRNLCEVTLLELIGWQIPDGVSIDCWSVVKVSIAIVARLRGVADSLRGLRGGIQDVGRERSQACEVGAV